MALTKIIDSCKIKGIRLILVNSPAFINAILTENINPIREMALNNKVEYLDYSADTTFLNNHTYFADPGHLNKDGAKIFSEIIVNFLKPYYGDSITVH